MNLKILMQPHYVFLTAVLLSVSTQGFAIPSHPIGGLTYEYSGQVNSISIGGSLRASKDVIPLDPYPRKNDACLVNPTSTANLGQAMRQPGDVINLGLPAGSTILAAHLYWAGSYSPDTIAPTYNLTAVTTSPILYSPAPTYPVGGVPMPASNALLPDFTVTLNGSVFTSDKNMTDIFLQTNTGLYNPAIYPGSIYPFDFFGGHADVTALVAATGNAVYTFGGLTVNTQGYHCFSNAVLAGWALHVVYENPVEPFRVVKLYDGFQIYRDASVLISPAGFTVPAVPAGKLVITTWDGDEGNSTAGALFSENLKINVPPSTTPTFPLSGPLNPLVDAGTGLPNQFNGTVNTTSPTFPLVIPSSTTSIGAAPAPWGIDVDHYDVSAQLTPGQTSLTTEYSSGTDLVILSSEIITLENDVFADLAITKTHVGNFGVGIPNNYTLSVSNVGTGILLDEPGPITVVDTLPAGLNYVSASGTGWACVFAGTLSCSHPGPLIKGASLPPITLTVTAPAVGTVTNTATVSGSVIDNLTLNNTATDLTNIIAPPILTVLKSASAGTATPGSVLTYNVLITNTGLGAATSVSQDDRLSRYTSLGIDCMPATAAQPTPHTITYTDGAPASTLTLGALSFSNDNGVTFAYVPPALGGGVCTFDPAITHFRQAMLGTMPSLGTYSLQYQTQVK